MTIREAQQRLLFQLYHLYDNAEASNIADLVMEKLTGWSRIDRTLNAKVVFSSRQVRDLEFYTQELQTGKPVQYALEECWFYGRRFRLSQEVLIPRPETEELVHWALQTIDSSSAVVLDIGTGSGCIAVTLKKESPSLEVMACDISKSALALATANAETLAADVKFELADILQQEEWKQFPALDLVISNPPYIPLQEKKEMISRVVGFEPHLALFVPDNDPLLFYRTIADFSQSKLKDGGRVIVEVHENFAEQVSALFEVCGFTGIAIRKDMQGKKRMVTGKKAASY